MNSSNGNNHKINGEIVLVHKCKKRSCNSCCYKETKKTYNTIIISILLLALVILGTYIIFIMTNFAEKVLADASKEVLMFCFGISSVTIAGLLFVIYELTKIMILHNHKPENGSYEILEKYIEKILDEKDNKTQKQGK